LFLIVHVKPIKDNLIGSLLYFLSKCRFWDLSPTFTLIFYNDKKHLDDTFVLYSL